MTEKEIPDLNIFMVCKKLNTNALTKLSGDFYIRKCKKEEFDIWAAFPFDSKKEAKEYYNFMVDYFDKTYASKEDVFYQKCLFVCDRNDKPIATCFIWKAYNKINAIHWFKTLKNYEGLGIGRALLSFIMKDLKDEEYPIYLHTQPASFRAIGLYSDFGFEILTDPMYGSRTNDYQKCLPILENFMTEKRYKGLTFTKAPKYFIEVVASSNNEEL